jgi:hypothetical protein
MEEIADGGRETKSYRSKKEETSWSIWFEIELTIEDTMIVSLLS